MGNMLKSEILSNDKGNLNGLAYRSFVETIAENTLIPEENNNNCRSMNANDNKIKSLIDMVHDNVIGHKLILDGPFGRRRCVYVDNTASGQPLKCIEEFIQNCVLPYYGNTHTSGTITSSQTTSYREEARDIIRKCVGSNDDDVVIFCGSGATRAIHKLVNALSLDNDRQLVVFVGPYEHHSNILPWKEKNAKVIFVPETRVGLFDFEFFENQLKIEAAKANKKSRLLIGAFSVASNVTGIPLDDIKITKLLHQYGALSCWDYSSAASHVNIFMNPGESPLTHKDAIYFSGHKFVGGPQTPGVLVAKRSIFEKKRASDGGGGGAVFFVTKDAHLYLKNIESREEAGTPAIIESIRLGLAFSLKNQISAENILAIEKSHMKILIKRWSNVPEIKILAHNNYPRTATISFVIQQLDIGYYLHHNFVVALLNDLFGIQTRGGCGCAGPYSQSLLGIDSKLAHKYKDLLLDANHKFCQNSFQCGKTESPCEIFKPGFVRVSLSFCSSEKDVEYVAEAVEFIAQRGYMLLPYYECNVATGSYYARDVSFFLSNSKSMNRISNRRIKLSSILFDSHGLNLVKDIDPSDTTNDCPSYFECLQDAENVVNNVREMEQNYIDESPVVFNSKLRWFVHQREALNLMQRSGQITRKIPPFIVASFDSANVHDLNSVTENSVLDQLRM